MKRLLELAISAVALVALSPVLVLLACVLRWRLGSPVLFGQARPGYRGAPFTLWKFRTLTDARDSSGQLLDDAQRMTRLGAWLRKTSLDELPELWNVLVGDMSLVGPRPLLMEYLPLYNAAQARRHEVRPGITGLAQISGRNALSWEDRFELDVWYVDNRSLWLDIKIIFITVWRVLCRADINHAEHATMPRFRGSIDDQR